MSYEYSENTLVQESAGHLLHDELGWEVSYAYNTEKLGVNGTFGRKTIGKSSSGGTSRMPCSN